MENSGVYGHPFVIDYEFFSFIEWLHPRSSLEMPGDLFGGAMRHILGTMTWLIAFGAGLMTAIAGFLTIIDLQGSWVLVEIQSRPVRPTAGNELPMFTIKDQSIEGFDGCNAFWGRLDKLGSMASTRLSCPESTLRLPLDLTDPMSHLRAGSINKKRMTLPERGAIPASVFQLKD